MIKKQFIQGGGIDLNGVTLKSLRSANGACGIAFPKLKANNVSIVCYMSGRYASSSGSVRGEMKTNNDANITRTDVTLSFKKNNADTPNNFTINDGRIMNGVTISKLEYEANAKRMTITFNDVEMIDD